MQWHDSSAVGRVMSSILRRRDSLTRFARYAVVVFAFLVGLKGTIAVNRWWLASYDAYLENLSYMVIGFLLFAILASRSKLGFTGYLLLAIGIYFIVNYEVGGPSKMYLTPFDPLLGIEPVFVEKEGWLGLSSIEYRWGMAVLTSLMAMLVLAYSKVRREGRKS